MAAQKQIFNVFVVAVAALLFVLAVAQASPLPVNAEEVVAEASAAVADDSNVERDGRYYGYPYHGGYGGYPYGGSGLASASATAVASANSGSIGYPFGK